MMNISILHALKTLTDPRHATSTGVELFRIAAGLTKQLGEDEASIAQTSTPGVNVFYQDRFPLKQRGRRRWYRSLRDLEAVDCYGFHTTGVNNGFGVTKRQMKPWLELWDQLKRNDAIAVGDPPEEHRDQIVAWIDPALGEERSRIAWARLMALRTRYLGLPYHSLSIVVVQELLINHVPRLVTHHGNRMNGYTWGHAFDDVWSDGEDVSEARVDHELAILERLHSHVVDRGARPGACELHSQHSRKPKDPGTQYLERVIVPFAREHKLEIRASVHTGKGKPIRGLAA